MGMKKVLFSRPKKHALTYSIVRGSSGNLTIVFHASDRIADKTGFAPGDNYEVYFDKDIGSMQIQRVPTRTRFSHRIRNVRNSNRPISGLNFGFSKYPFDPYFPPASMRPVEVIKAESGVLLIRAPKTAEAE